MTASNLHLKDTPLPHIKKVYLGKSEIGILDERGEGTFKTDKVDLFFKKGRITISAELLLNFETHFNKVVVEYDGKRFTTSRKKFLESPKRSNIYGQDKIRLPFEAFDIEVIQSSLFNEEEV